MRIQSLNGVLSAGNINGTSRLKTRTSASVYNSNSKKVIDINNYRPAYFSRALTFTSRPDKNYAQIASIAPEYQGILNSVYKAGGLGNVTGEAAVSFADYEGMDIRTFVPYYSAENKAQADETVRGSGFIQVKYPVMNEDGTQALRKYKTIGADKTIVERTEPAFDFKKVQLGEYVLQKGEEYVSHQAIDPDKPLKGQFISLEETGIKGQVESVKDDLSGVKKVPYTLFKVKGTGTDIKGSPAVYLIHTPELSQFKSAYAYDGGMFTDAAYGAFSRAAADVMPKLNDEKFGDFNPASFWLHDRQAFPVMLSTSEASSNGSEYWRGIKEHATYHNPTRAYQGVYDNPIDFMRVVGNEGDLEQLKKNPDDYEFVREMIEQINTKAKDGVTKLDEALSKEQLDRLNRIFKPLYGEFIDENGKYNMCMIPVAGKLKNPYNFSLGSVSENFGKEMESHNTPEIAEGLTSKFAAVSTENVTNGSSASSLRLDEIGSFGMGKDFPAEIKKDFTPLTPEILNDKEKLYAAKKANKEWFINAISAAIAKGKEGIEQLLNQDDIKGGEEGYSILGNFSKYKDGDMLFINWGRPDPQKGYVTALNGVLDFFKDESIPVERREKVKYLCVGGPWKKSGSEWPCEWENIKKIMGQIQELDNGRYKDNVIYINGRFSNRMVACADYAQITSRFEPCGITPLEAFSAGTPVLSHNTGGSPDFCTALKEGERVTNQNSFLTEHAFMVKPDVIGLDKGLADDALDEGRVTALAKEDADSIRRAVDLYLDRPDEYKQMSQNALQAQIGWHENGAFNRGDQSANRRYIEDIFGVNIATKKPVTEPNTEPLVSLKGIIAQKQYKETAGQIAQNGVSFGNQAKGFKLTGKHAALITAAVAAIAGLGALLTKSKGKKDNKPNMEISNTKDTNHVSNAAVSDPISKDVSSADTAPQAETYAAPQSKTSISPILATYLKTNPNQ